MAYETTDKKISKHFESLSGIKLPKNAQKVVDIPLKPNIYFERTVIGWRKNIESKGSKSSYTTSDFPAKQADYIAEELYNQIYKEFKNVRDSIPAYHQSVLKKVLCCERWSFWLAILFILCFFGGLALFAASRGNESLNSYVNTSIILMCVGAVGFILYIVWRKYQKRKQKQTLNVLLIDLETRVNQSDVMKAQNNDWKTKLFAVIAKKPRKGEKDKWVFKIGIYRSL